MEHNRSLGLEAKGQDWVYGRSEAENWRESRVISCKNANPDRSGKGAEKALLPLAIVLVEEERCWPSRWAGVAWVRVLCTVRTVVVADIRSQVEMTDIQAAVGAAAAEPGDWDTASTTTVPSMQSARATACTGSRKAAEAVDSRIDSGLVFVAPRAPVQAEAYGI